PLDLTEVVSSGEEVGDDEVATVAGIRQIADFVRNVERATHQITTLTDVFCPGQDDPSEDHVGGGLEPLQSPLFDQFISDAAEPESSLVVAEARSGGFAQPDVVHA